jgi:hypothetical protein
MSAVGGDGTVAQAKAHPASRGLGIAGIVLGLIAVGIPVLIYLVALLPGQMGWMVFFYFTWPVMIGLSVIGLVLSVIGLIIGLTAKRGVPGAAIVGAVLNVLVLAGTFFMFSGGLSPFL